jgi:hypothetical protein
LPINTERQRREKKGGGEEDLGRIKTKNEGGVVGEKI